MALVYSADATITPPMSTMRNSAVSKFLSSSRCRNVVVQSAVLDKASTSLSNSFRKLKSSYVSPVAVFQYYKPLIVSVSGVIASPDKKNIALHLHDLLLKTRAYLGGNPPNTDKNGDSYTGEHCKEDTYDLRNDYKIQDDDVEIKIEKTGYNCRVIRSKIFVQANLQIVWDVLTDYERLAEFIPGLAVSQLLEKRDKFARLYQVGEQNLAFGLKFNAKGTVDCFERDLEIIPNGHRRDIDFKMLEGDFQLFEGKWSVEQVMKLNADDLLSDAGIVQEFETTLFYVVHVKPNMWLPVRLIEGRLSEEIKKNLSCIRKEAEKDFLNANTVV